MFSYTNVVLVVPHEPYEICFAFLFEVYVKQSQICDTFPTSKMELFVIKRICKVISSRLMILYTQYCPKSEIVLFVAITITNVVFYRAMVLHTKFLPMNFLFFVLVRCWVHFVAGGYTLFQVIPGSSSLFQVVPARPSSFLVLVCTIRN